MEGWVHYHQRNSLGVNTQRYVVISVHVNHEKPDAPESVLLKAILTVDELLHEFVLKRVGVVRGNDEKDRVKAFRFLYFLPEIGVLEGLTYMLGHSAQKFSVFDI